MTETAGVCCSGSMFTGGNIFAALIFSVVTAAIVVGLTQWLRPEAKTAVTTTVVHEHCKKCDSNGRVVVQDADQREYKIERGSFTPSDGTIRGKVWHQHPTWHIPSLEREKIQVFSGIEDVLRILDRFDVSPHRGFLPEKDPLQRLPQEKYYLWEDMADDLPRLLGARLGQVREPLSRLPVISTDDLTTTEELRRAQLLLCLFAHAFVWGGTPVMEYIPRGISIPLWEVSCRLDTPPVLMNMAITLYNWRRLDPNAGLNMMNLSTLNNFFSGRDESWFYLITVEIEAIGAAAVVPLMQLNFDIKRARADPATQMEGGEKHLVRNVILLEAITSKLLIVADCIDKMTTSLNTMREGCHPFIFYHRVRPFLAGWKSNPALPNGVKYEGVYMKWEDRPIPSEDAVKTDNVSPNFGSPSGSWLKGAMSSEGKGGLAECPSQFFSGGSAAQSALLPFLDILLGIDHSAHDSSPNSKGFLASMRQYMPRQHREFLQYLEGETCIRNFMTSCRKELVKELDLPPSAPPTPEPQAETVQDSTPNRSEKSDGEPSTDVSEGSASGSGSGSGSGEDSPSKNGVSWVWRGEGGNATAVTAEDGLDDRVGDALKNLCEAYDLCLLNFSKFRTGHISIVAEYILAQQRHGVSDKSIEGNAGGKGTGGTDLINFLKPIRDNCTDGTLLAKKVTDEDDI